MPEKKIRIFMCTHKEFSCLPPLAVAVRGGAANNPAVSGAVADVGPRGDISAKNPEYCELTVQYYAWRNEECDVYGFCHYRRFFAFGKKSKKPYLVCGDMTEKWRNTLGTDTDIRALSDSFDIILPHKEDLGVSAREYYEQAPYAYKEDLDLFLSILNERAPHLSEFAERYLSGREQYFCNMFLMRKELFFEYSELLFDILSEFDKKKTLHGDFQSDRTDGYLAERFLGIFVLFARSRGASVFTVPRLDAYAPLSKRIIYKLFPPESRLRFFAKRIASRFK